MKDLRYRMEAGLLAALMAFCKALPPQTASSLFGTLARCIGPKLAASRKARANISRALPDLSALEIDTVVADMWENLGRVISEYPHLETLADHHTEMLNHPIQLEALAKGRGVIYIAAHMANWEMNATTNLVKNNIALDLGYRAPNNPYVDTMLQKYRGLNGKIRTFPKSSAGGRHMMHTIKNKGCLGILIDQKYREGITVPFFGRPAPTNPFFIQIAQKYDVPVIPVRAERLDGARFRLTVHPEIVTKNRTPEDILNEVHGLFETWIRERPGQWLWLHRRWKDEA